MIKNNRLKLLLVKCFTSFAIVLATFSNSAAQNNTDTIKKILLASANFYNKPSYILKEANVIFPDILKGNEDASTAYITSFSEKKRTYLKMLYTKTKKMLPRINIIFKKYHLPEELGTLMLLESGGNGNAVSKAGAVGYWQIMDEVAKEYGLKYGHQLNSAEKKKISKLNTKKAGAFFKARGKQKDDRKNFYKSTMAAARYLHERRLNLDDNWLLVVASYNCGVGNVWNAMKKSGKENASFWDIKKYLPAETQAYVLNFITLNVIFCNYDNFINNNLNFTAVKITMPDNFEHINLPETEENSTSSDK
jgi:membrane-bound lytic murein transglycosylase D